MRYSTLSLCALLTVCLFGCNSSADKPKKVASVPDDPAAVESLKDIAELKMDKRGNVAEVNFRGVEVTDDMFAHLAGFPKLRSVLLNETAITDSSLEAIGKLKSVTNLDLRGCGVSNDGLKHLSGMTQLKALRLNGKNGKATVDDSGLAELSELTNLKVLALDFLLVSVDGLSLIPNLNAMEELYMAGTAFDDDAVPVLLESFPRLKKLRVAQTTLSDVGLEQLASLATLTDLDISENSLLSDVGMQHVGSMKGLTKLNLWRLAVTDDGIRHLSGLTRLKWLNLDNTQLADPGLIHLQKMTELEFLHLGSTLVTDEGIPQLEGLKSLKDLKLTRTAVTEAGAAKLGESLSGTQIQLKYRDGE